MNEPWIERWNDRYSKDEFAYGEQPNNYLKEQLQKLDAGAILFPAEGEGRNAVFAAKLGWTVSAFDISVEGKKKALLLAEINKVIGGKTDTLWGKTQPTSSGRCVVQDIAQIEQDALQKSLRRVCFVR